MIFNQSNATQLAVELEVIIKLNFFSSSVGSELQTTPLTLTLKATTTSNEVDFLSASIIAPPGWWSIK
jgi:hypothetical protein